MLVSMYLLRIGYSMFMVHSQRDNLHTYLLVSQPGIVAWNSAEIGHDSKKITTHP